MGGEVGAKEVGEGERRGQQDGWEEGGKGGGLPFDPRPQRCYQARPTGKILPRSLHIPALLGWFYSLMVQPDTVYDSPILCPLSPGPKGIWPGWGRLVEAGVPRPASQPLL